MISELERNGYSVRGTELAKSEPRMLKLLRDLGLNVMAGPVPSSKEAERDR